MIWIATVLLLFIAAWLLLNARNEKRWVDAHSHDESVASDPGFLPSFSAITEKLAHSGNERGSIERENTRFARAVQKVQERTAKYGERIEAKVRAARVDESGQREAEPSFFDRMVDKLGGGATRLDERLDARAHRAAGKSGSATASSGDTNGSSSIKVDDGLFGKAVAAVSERGDRYSTSLRERNRHKADRMVEDEATRGSVPRRDDEGLFGRMVAGVTRGLAVTEKRIDDRMSNARVDGPTPSLANDDDVMSRMSAKIGGRVNEIDEKIVEKSRDVADKVDRGMSGTGKPDGNGTKG